MFNRWRDSFTGQTLNNWTTAQTIHLVHIMHILIRSKISENKRESLDRCVMHCCGKRRVLKFTENFHATTEAHAPSFKILPMLCWCFPLFDAAVFGCFYWCCVCFCLSQAIIIIPLLLRYVRVCVFNALHILTSSQRAHLIYAHSFG